VENNENEAVAGVKGSGCVSTLEFFGTSFIHQKGTDDCRLSISRRPGRKGPENPILKPLENPLMRN